MEKSPVFDIFDLPKHFVAELLSKWIYTDSLTKFDTALLSRKRRSPCLELFQTAYFATHGIHGASLLSSSCVLWLILRKLKIRHLTLKFGLADVPVLLMLDVSKIEVVDFTNSRFTNKSNVSHLLDRCSNVKELSLSGNDLVTSAFLRQVVRGCGLLHTLNISNCKGVSDIAIKRMAPHCSAVTNLDISRCKNITAKSFYTLSTHCRRLTSLNISGCSAISRDAITSLVTSNGQLGMLSAGMCFEITDLTLVDILTVSGGSQLLNIDLTWCSQLTDLSLEHLARHCNRLEALTISLCLNVTDQGIALLVEQCVKLVALNVSECNVLTDMAVRSLSAQCPLLRDLNLSGCHLLTSEALSSLASSCCSNLRSVYLNNCCRVRNYETVLDLLNNKLQLEMLDLRGTLVGHKQQIADAAGRRTTILY